ncbi:ankyrin repeat protein [Planoprotostelium fungivorum]|uniref:Ankyrin repeat protein n=1 Tax=Planoprotostelium fungivorum TaxID=1890364 RepID=A0A2P6N7R0_9EUKA|nr:ankyrin repeat protein [Planoprotostelium fungivorum]
MKEKEEDEPTPPKTPPTEANNKHRSKSLKTSSDGRVLTNPTSPRTPRSIRTFLEKLGKRNSLALPESPIGKRGEKMNDLEETVALESPPPPEEVNEKEITLKGFHKYKAASLDSIPLGEKKTTENEEREEEREEGEEREEREERGEKEGQTTPEARISPRTPDASPSRNHRLMKFLPHLDERSVNIANIVCMNQGTRSFFDSIDVSESAASLSVKDGEGNTVLHYASMLGQVELVRHLINKGVKVNEPNNKGITALHFSVCKTSPLHTMTAELLLNSGAKVNARTNDNETPLHYAVVRGRSIGKSTNGNMFSTLLLTKWKVDPSVRDSSAGRTPLHYAAQFNYYHICNVILERSRNIIDIRDDKGYTALHIAAAYGNLEVSRLLLLRGASIHILTEDHLTPLHLACKFMKPRIVDLLMVNIEAQSRTRNVVFSVLDKRDKRGFSAAHYAAIRFPDFLNLKDHLGLTPCLWALSKGNKSCLLYLISKDQSMLSLIDRDNLFPFSIELSVAIKNPEFSDLKVYVEGTLVPAHRIVLYRCFRTQIKDDEPVQTLELDPRIKMDPFMDLCSYLYTGRVPTGDAQLRGLLEVSNILQFGLLRQICETALLSKGKLLRVSTLPQYLGTILDKGIFVDIEVTVERKKFRLHQFVLAFRCKYLYDQLKKNGKKVEDNTLDSKLRSASNSSVNQNSIDSYSSSENIRYDFLNEQNNHRSPGVTLELLEVTRLSFACIVDFLYTDVVRRIESLIPEDLKNLHRTAIQFGLPRLARKCELYLYERINDGNCVDIYHLADEKTMPTLHRGCVDFIASDYKRTLKSRGLEGLSGSQHDELRKRYKEMKKEGTTLEPNAGSKKKGKGKVPEPERPTPDQFFARRAPLGAMPPMRPTLERRNSLKW